MAGVSLAEAKPFDGYSCPFCPTQVMVMTGQQPPSLMLVGTQEQARKVMESHLDGHFSIGLPAEVAA